MCGSLPSGQPSLVERAKRALPAVFLVALAGSFAATAAPAQEGVSLSRVEVALWPEYDRPEMLVIYRATVAADTGLPAEVRFRIPASAGPPNAVAGADSSGRLVNLEYERRVEGDAAWIVLTARRPDVQIEYYDPGLQRDGARRSYAFVWPGEHPVAELSVQVQRPVGGRELNVSPRPAAQGVADDGLLYADVPLGPVPAGETRRVELDYVKPDDGLTAGSLARTPSDPAASREPGGGAAPPDLPLGWIVGGIALLLAAGLAGFLLLRPSGTGDGMAGPVGRERSRSKASGRPGSGRARSGDEPAIAPDAARKPGAGRGTAADGGPETSRFCTQCGAPAREDDRFCHACGAGLR